VRQGQATEEKHALPTDEEVRESKQDMDRQQRKRMHFLQMRR
jgi:hypothetical protein